MQETSTCMGAACFVVASLTHSSVQRDTNFESPISMALCSVVVVPFPMETVCRALPCSASRTSALSASASSTALQQMCHIRASLSAETAVKIASCRQYCTHLVSGVKLAHGVSASQSRRTQLQWARNTVQDRAAMKPFTCTRLLVHSQVLAELCSPRLQASAQLTFWPQH